MHFIHFRYEVENMNNLDSNSQRSTFRRNAWCSSFSCVEMLSLFLSAASTALSLARSNIKYESESDIEKILFACEVSCLFISSFIQWIGNINMIENLRLLHGENKTMRAAAAYGNSNGLAKGVALPTHVAFFIAILGSTASILFFCKVFSGTHLSNENSKMISEVVGTSAPFISSVIASLAKSRLEKEESHLEKITSKTADGLSGRDACKIVFCCCR